MSVTIGAGTAHSSGTPEFTPVFSGVRVIRSSVLMFFIDVLSVLRYKNLITPLISSNFS